MCLQRWFEFRSKTRGATSLLCKAICCGVHRFFFLISNLGVPNLCRASCEDVPNEIQPFLSELRKTRSSFQGRSRTRTEMEMACGQTFRQNEGECGQEELLPGIPDHITIQNIAPKLTWKTSNMMQMVSRGWGNAIRSRDIYNARVISQSTETFLVLRSEEQPKNFILILYSCSYGTHLRLPPIPMTGKIYPYACICMDARVYVWAVADYWEKFSLRRRTELWVLDLVGERRWTRRGPVRHLLMSQCGVLEGKIYQFGGYIPSGSRPSKLPIHLKVKVVAKAQVYDPQSNIWSTIITPEPLRDVDTASGADLERKLASFSEWARQESSQAGPLPIVGPYEPFYSDWRSRLSTNLACNNDAFYRNGMALQVYHKSQDRMLNLFFIGGKLVRLGQRPGRACSILRHSILRRKHGSTGSVSKRRVMT